MGRRRMYDRERYTLPGSVVDLVESICGDYYRREKTIEAGKDERVVATCLRINGVIDNALLDIEEGMRRDMLFDIAEGRGYDRSALQLKISKRAYYNRRRKLVYDVACGLSLMREKT